jgi:hypothetical protein
MFDARTDSGSLHMPLGGFELDAHLSELVAEALLEGGHCLRQLLYHSGHLGIDGDVC